jgi:4-amino-4-deoxy-L-arabinose transferase-like glycosyltransferase
VLAAIAAVWAGAALMTRRAAFAGAAMFAVSVMLGMEGMTAKTDAVLCGLTTLAMAALARVYAGKGGKRTVLIFWAALAAGILVKGPVTPLVVGLTLLALFAFERRANWMKALLFAPGPILAAVMVLPWVIAIQGATAGSFLTDAFTNDVAPKIAGGQEGHWAPPGTHILALILLGFPFILALPAGFLAAFEGARDTSGAEANRMQKTPALFLLCWAIPIWIFFELLPTKLPHYTLPAFPALALLAGWAFARDDDDDRPMARTTGLILFALSAALIFGIAGYAGAYFGGRTPTALYNAGILAALGGLLAVRGAGLMRKTTRQHTLIWAVGLALLWHGIGREILAPRAQELWIAPRINEALLKAGLHPRLSIGAPGPLVTVGFPEPSLVFLTRKDTVNKDVTEAIAQARPDSGAVISRDDLAAFQMGLLARDLQMDVVARVSGFNYSKGRRAEVLVGKIVPAQMIDAEAKRTTETK